MKVADLRRGMSIPDLNRMCKSAKFNINKAQTSKSL